MTKRSSAADSTVSLLAAPTLAATSLPVAFDSGVGNNFTNPSCKRFFNSFPYSNTFRACHPLSQLILTSNSFFTASGSVASLTQTLDASCSVNLDQCNAVMDDLAVQIQSDDVCGAELALGNAMVSQAFVGFLAYQPLYQAGCLKDAEGAYCFADALTNRDSPTDPYVYYLALGWNLPAGTRPTCNSCLRRTMRMFAAAAANSTQPISDVYVEAAEQINIACGPTFVNTTVPMLPDSAGATAGLGLFAPLITLVALIWTLFL